MKTDQPVAVSREVEERFWALVDRRGPDECWEWTGARNKPNGRRFDNGKFKVAGKLVLAHRFAYTISRGEIPQGLMVRHVCDNPPCCNPAHLLIGTHADNMRDRHVRGRTRPGRLLGEANPQSKLTEHDVIAIRASDETSSELAARFHISTSQIRAIRTRVRWKHV